MTDDKINSLGSGIGGAIKGLGHVGVIATLWTTVVCVALWRSDAEVTTRLWPELRNVWLGIVGVWFVGLMAGSVGAVIGAVRDRFSKKQS